MELEFVAIFIMEFQEKKNMFMQIFRFYGN
jgi:hypothetical protein